MMGHSGRGGDIVVVPGLVVVGLSCLGGLQRPTGWLGEALVAPRMAWGALRIVQQHQGCLWQCEGWLQGSPAVPRAALGGSGSTRGGSRGLRWCGWQRGQVPGLSAGTRGGSGHLRRLVG